MIIHMSKRPPRRSDKQPGRGVSVERGRGGSGWVLVHPAAAREATEDLDEVRAMIAAGETDIAIDELRWLLEECPELIEAHYLLGKLAVETNHDLPLARGHFGIGFELGTKALARAGDPAPLAALHPANRPFFDAGRGLAWCLAEQGLRDTAIEVVERLLKCDPTDPLGLGGWIDELRTGGAPIVELS